MAKLNYHHLYYFWQVATHGNLTEVAQRLNLSQSALSAQIQQLERRFGTPLFERQGRKLLLTESGRKVLGYADDIFVRGEELEAWLRQGALHGHQIVRIGTVATMSRNFIELFLTPLLSQPELQLSVQAKPLSDLLDGLSKHQYDIVLANTHVATALGSPLQCQLLGRQPVTIVGPAALRPNTINAETLASWRWVLPSRHSDMRAAFDAWCSLMQLEPNLLCEVDDMAMLRLLARDSGALAVMPKVVVRDEIRSGLLCEYVQLPNVEENFYGITIKRQFTPPALIERLAQFQQNEIIAQ